MKIKHKTAGILVGLLLCRSTVYGQTLKEPEIQSQAAVVMDMQSGEFLYEKNEDKQYYPASIVKLLTALVVAERTDPEATVVLSHEAVYGVEEGSGNPLGLEAGDKMTVEGCMYAMLLESSNQAANALAEYVAGSNEKFAGYMNEKAAELGCTDSNFVNPSGLNDEKQLVTAKDMALIAKAALTNPVVREIASAKTYRLDSTLNNVNGITLQMEHQLLNGDTYSYPYAFAGKTGYTELAGNTLVTAAKKNDEEILAVVLKSDMTHYQDTISLLDYGFQKLEQQEKITEVPEEAETEVTTVPEVDNNTATNIPAGLIRTVAVAAAAVAAGYSALVVLQRHRRKLRKARRRKKMPISQIYVAFLIYTTLR